MELTPGQKQRLNELDIFAEYEQAGEREFPSAEERDEYFRQVEKKLVDLNRERLKDLTGEKFLPELRRLEADLRDVLLELGFTEVTTPIRLARGHLEKMGIDEDHPLWQQVYWLEGGDYCLRPMHAPHLYSVLGRFDKTLEQPISIFEVGTCFRKETGGRRHLSEFNMLNLVELGPVKEPEERLQDIIAAVMEGLELDYELLEEDSHVYGQTFDVEIKGMEIASGAVGPHELDEPWEISDSWAGLGLGLERLIMAREGMKNITRVGRSLIYQDGGRLNV